MNRRSAARIARRLRNSLALSAALSLAAVAAHAQTAQLNTGKKITLPALGVQQNVGSLPMNIVLTPNGKYAISTDMGFRESLWCIDANTGRGVSHLDFDNATNVTNGLYYGLAVKDNGDGSTTVYASQGANSTIAIINVAADGTLTQTGTITLSAGDLIAGLALDNRGYLYAVVNQFSLPTIDTRALTTPGHLVVINTATQAEVGRVVTSTIPQLTNFPFVVQALGDGSRVYVSSQRDATVYTFNATNPAAPVLTGGVQTGYHPVSLLLNKAQTLLYVANAHSDTIIVISTVTGSIVGQISVRPAGAATLAGATPNNLTLSPDEKTLYATLGDMNAVAVIDLTKGSVAGYIPTGWHPTGVAVTAKKKLLVTNAKGTVTRNPNKNALPLDHNGALTTYILSIIEGNVSTIGVPTPTLLAQYTQQVLANNGITANTANPANPLSGIGLAAGKIQHVFYIIKENRTYDQVLGDLTDANGQPVGNGDPSLTIYGKTVTPNLHNLALRFVTLDNFYDCGEASGDGWPWSTQSFATEYVIKNLPYNYSNRTSSANYDFEGQNNGYPVGGFPAAFDGVALSPGFFPNGAPQIPDVSEAPANHIWDQALKAGRTVRNYGFFLTQGLPGALPDNFPGAKGLQPAGHDLAGISDIDFRRFDLDYADSDAGQIYHDQLVATDPATAANCLYPTQTYGKHSAPSRFSEWNNEFQQMLTADPTGNTVPNLSLVRFMSDHTEGYNAGHHTPDSHVADNDYAVGQFVDAISKSPIWNSSAIFVIEDDAQDGQDHVDAHRSTCYVISPYIKKNSVDHTFYNTDSVLKTMELLLGLPPMSQYDATANPILNWDTTPGNIDSYNAVLPPLNIIDHLAINRTPSQKMLAKMTEKIDFSHADAADPGLLNTILWKYAKGDSAPVPAPRHTVVPTRAVAPKSAGKTAAFSKQAALKSRDLDE